MESANFTALAGEPCDFLPREPLKPLESITRLLEIRTRRQVAVCHASETAAKAAVTLVGSILLNAGNDAGNELGSAAENLIFATLKAIRAAPDPLAALDAAMRKFDPQNRETPLKVHRTTVAGMVPEMTRAEMDAKIADQYVEQMASLGENHAQAPKVALAIDNTSQRVKTEHPNGAFSPVKAGGKAAWEQGFKYPTIFDTTHQLFVGCHHEDHYPAKAGRAPALPPAAQDLQDKVAVVKRAGSAVAVIEGDRDYFKGELFAAATLGLLNPGAEPRDQPRLVVPRKFGPEKERVTWDFLLKEDKPAVSVEHVKASPLASSPLGTACTGAFQKDEGGAYLVPYANVALIGEWSGGESRDLAETRAEAREVQEGIAACEKLREDTEAKYVNHLETVTEEEGKKPSYGRGSPRKKFHDEKDERLYKKLARRKGGYAAKGFSLFGLKNCILFFILLFFTPF